MSKKQADSKPSNNNLQNSIKDTLTVNIPRSDVIKLYSTLQEQKDAIQGGPRTNQAQSPSNINSFLLNKNLLSNIRAKLQKRIFKANQLLLSFQMITSSIYQIFILLEFLQLLFFLLQPFTLINEVVEQQTQNNQKTVLSNLLNTNSTTNIVGLQEDYAVNIGDYLQYANFAVLFIKIDQDSKFLEMIITWNAIFIIFLVFLGSGAPRLFKYNQHGISNGLVKRTCQFFSILMQCFILPLQIPMLIMNFQAYQCDEDLDLVYRLATVCTSSTHTLFVGIATLGLILYFGFLYIQESLYNSHHFEAHMPPWSGTHGCQRVIMLKSALKLIVCAVFIFDKHGGLIRGYSEIGCFVICLAILHQRITQAVILKEQIFRAQVLYESILTFFYIIIGIHHFTLQELTLSRLGLISAASILFGLIVVLATVINKKNSLLLHNPFKKLHTISDYELYFARIFKAINSKSYQKQKEMDALLVNHMSECEFNLCECHQIIKDLENRDFDNDHYLVNEESIDSSLKNNTQDNNSKSLIKQFTDQSNATTAVPFSFKIIDETIENNSFLQKSQKQIINSEEFCNTPTANFIKSVSALAKEQNKFYKKNSSPQLEAINMSFPLSSISNDLYSKPSIINDEIIQNYNFRRLNSKKKTILRTNSNTSVHAVWLVQKALIQDNSFDFNGDELCQEQRRIHWHRFLSLLIKQAMIQFPDSASLKIMLSSIEKEKLGNDFNAMFELFKCEISAKQLTFGERFNIFRMKVDIERSMQQQNLKNSQINGNLDSSIVYQYEKYFQQFALQEFMTAQNILKFWRELNQKSMNFSHIQIKGSAIQKNYDKMVQTTNELIKLSPNDIKVRYRYGLYLKQVGNNEFEAQQQFETCYQLYYSQVSKKFQQVQTRTQSYEAQLFGENTASSIFVMSARSNKDLGTIVYANEEVRNLLGFTPKQLIGQNVQIIMPRPFGEYHDQFIIQYLKTGVSKLLNNKNLVFAQDSNGYLKSVHLLVKFYPQLSDKLQFIGFIAPAYIFPGLDDPPERLMKREYHYMITDNYGYVSNVSEGLNRECGFHSQFLQGRNVKSLNISMICPELVVDKISGSVLQFDTREIINQVDLESFTSQDQVHNVREKLGIFKAYVSLKVFKFDYLGRSINLYRIILLQNDEDENNFINSEVLVQNILNTHLEIAVSNAQNVDPLHSQSIQQQDDEFTATQGTASCSSASPSGTSQFFNTGFGKTLRDFKTALTTRETPKNLRTLNWILIIGILSIIVISSVHESLIGQLILTLDDGCNHELNMAVRNLNLVLLASNIRSLVNVASNYEPNSYEGEHLKKIDRYSYLSQLVQTQAEELQVAHNFITKNRNDQDPEVQAGRSDAEVTPIEVVRLDQLNRFYRHQLPFRVAFQSYLNSVLLLNHTTMDNIRLVDPLIQGAPPMSLNPIIQNLPQTTDLQKNVVFILVNGLRSLREQSMKSTIASNDKAFSYTMDDVFLSLVIIVVLINITMVSAIIYQVWHSESSKDDILYLFSLLKQDDIVNVTNRCKIYLKEIQIAGGFINEAKIEDYEDFNKKTFKASAKKSDKMLHNPQIDLSDVSEEEKDNDSQHDINILKNNRTFQTRAPIQVNYSQEIYSEMLRRALFHIKEIHDNQFIEAIQQQIKSVAAVDISQDFIEFNDEKLASKKLISKAFKTPAKGNNELRTSKSNLKKAPKSKFPKTLAELQDQESIPEMPSENEDQPQKPKKSKPKFEEEFELKLPLQAASYQNMSVMIIARRFKFILMISLIAMIYSIYFIYLQFFHVIEMDGLRAIKDATPVLLNRYSDLILSYAFLRERILTNNSLTTFISEFQMSQQNTQEDIDTYYNEQSLSDERYISKLKVQVDSQHLDNLIAFMQISDSEQFCTNVEDMQSFGTQETSAQTRISKKALLAIQEAAYQFEIQTVIASLTATYRGDLGSLTNLHLLGVDLSKGDFDGMTSLHIACRLGMNEIVAYLIEVAQVEVNPLNRWGETPMGEAHKHPELTTYLQNKGGKVGANIYREAPLDVTLEANQYRLLYAAYYGDVAMMENLRLLGWNINAQDTNGRTALNIAASQGHLEAVKYLIKKGALLDIADIRGNQPLDDAKRENRTSVVKYLDTIVNEATIQDYCSKFQDGLLDKGMSYAIGIFNKRFVDLQMSVNSTKSYKQMLQILNYTVPTYITVPTTNFKVIRVVNATTSNTTNNVTTIPVVNASLSAQKSIHMFFSTQELYLHRICIKVTEHFDQTLLDFIDSYSSITFDLFMAFLVYQLVSLLYIRRWLVSLMKQEVFQSRGILNLIPERFFQLNKEHAEKIIKRLKA